MNKKCISPVVATALLLVVAVVATVSFQGWFAGYQSVMFSDTEIKSDSALDGTILIDSLVGNDLYVINNVENNLSITSLKINGNECLITDNLTLNINSIDVADCISNLSDSALNVVLITEKNVVSKYIYRNIYSSSVGGVSEFVSLLATGNVSYNQKISDLYGGFTGTLIDYDAFGGPVVGLGDLDGDGVEDLAAGAYTDVAGDLGVVWILFLNENGTVKSYQQISNTEGNFTGVIEGRDDFGSGLGNLGDLNGDGVVDLAVGATHDDDLNGDSGAIYILFLNEDGTVKSHQKISNTQGNFTGTLATGDWFGNSITNLGDLNNDGVIDLAVGAYLDDNGGLNRGAVWILFMNSDGTVKTQQKISDTAGNFTGVLGNTDYFGASVSGLGDLNDDGVEDLAVGATADDDGFGDAGAVWILFLNEDGVVKSHQKISATEGNFTETLGASDHFGGISNLGDLNGDDIIDLAVSASGDDDGGTDRGAFYILYLNSDGKVKNSDKISDTEGNFTGVLDNSDYFGGAANIGDLNNDGIIDLAVGVRNDDDGGTNRGAIYILFLQGE